jgi:hypothetical protein
VCEPRSGAEIRRPRWWRLPWARIQTSRRPVPQPKTAGSGRHQRDDGGGFEVTRTLPSGRTVTYYTHVPRDATLTTMVRPVTGESPTVLDRTQLVPFRPAGEDCR